MSDQVQTQAQETRKTALCDSCGVVGLINEVPHHQAGNDKVWHYCDSCKAAHDKEAATLKNLKELQKTHPEHVNKPEIAGMFNSGKTLDEVKKYLDTTKQPSLEAEVQQ